MAIVVDIVIIARKTMTIVNLFLRSIGSSYPYNAYSTVERP